MFRINPSLPGSLSPKRLEGEKNAAASRSRQGIGMLGRSNLWVNMRALTSPPQTSISTSTSTRTIHEHEHEHRGAEHEQ